MLKSTMKLSESEIALAEIVKEIGFGEAIDITVEQQIPSRLFDVSDQVRDLIMMVRGGTQHISTLIIHEHEPQFVIVEYEKNGFRCRKRTKLPRQV